MNALDWTFVKQNIFNWVKGEIDGGLITELDEGQVIWREQSTPLPARPCIAMKIISGPRKLGSTDNYSLKAGSDGIFDAGGQRAITLSVQVFGNATQQDSAQVVAQKLHISLSKISVTDAFAAGILDGSVRKGVLAVWEVGDVSDISALEETEFEDRAQFDVIMGVTDNIEDQPGVIETIETTPNITT